MRNEGGSLFVRVCLSVCKIIIIPLVYIQRESWQTGEVFCREHWDFMRLSSELELALSGLLQSLVLVCHRFGETLFCVPGFHWQCGCR